jgi:hypothetical protein
MRTAAHMHRMRRYRAKLDEDNEVPTVNTTPEGVINFKSKDHSMSWKMNITGINVATKLYWGS